MSSIIKLGKSAGKDCNDWCPLKDGTQTGDTKYCDLSQKCRQMGMKSDYYNFYNHETSVYETDYFCTGFYVKEDDLGKDEEVS